MAEAWVFVVGLVLSSILIITPIIFLGLSVKKSAWWLKWLFLIFFLLLSSASTAMLDVVLQFYGINESVNNIVNGLYYANLFAALLCISLFLISIVTKTFKSLQDAASERQAKEIAIYEDDL